MAGFDGSAMRCVIGGIELEVILSERAGDEEYLV